MNQIFSYVAGDDRHLAVIKKTNLLGGLNQLLVRNGYKEISTVAKALKFCEEKGLLSSEDLAQAHSINSDGNMGNHHWEMKKNKRKSRKKQ
jgi:hypothetical protein